MLFARLIARLFKPEQPDFAAMGDGLRRVLSGEIDSYELPPGWSFQILKPEPPNCGGNAEGNPESAESYSDHGRPMHEAGPHNGADAHSNIFRPVRHEVIAPLADPEQAKAGSRHGCVFPAGGDKGSGPCNAYCGSRVPPLHFFIDRIHRRIMGGKTAAAQGEA